MINAGFTTKRLSKMKIYNIKKVEPKDREAVLQAMATPIVEMAKGRKTLVFATPGYAGEEPMDG